MNENKKIEQSKRQKIEEYISARYLTQYNVIKSRIEYKLINNKGKFKPIDDYTINSIRRGLDKKTNIRSSFEDITSILESDYSSKVNPIKNYFNNLEAKDPKITRAIYQLAQTITTDNPEKWEHYLTMWLVATVANALTDEGCQNHTCLVLVGDQGAFKTTWLNLLCPKELKEYLFVGKIKPNDKDTLSLLAECIFINIDDQLDDLNKAGENSLKDIITAPKVTYRRAYARFIQEYPRCASFMASVNGFEFLTDPTGSRRFIPFEVKHIEIEKAKKIDIHTVYSEVMYLWKNGFRYYFTKDEVRELHNSNMRFQQQTVEYDMLIKGFEHPLDADNESFMTTADIISYLNTWTNIHYNEKNMGKALLTAGYSRVMKRIDGQPKYVYKIRTRKPNPFIDREL